MISAKPWGIEAVARLFMGVVATLCAGIFISGLLDATKLHLSPDQFEFVQTVIMVVLFQGAALAWIAVFLLQSNISWRNAFGLRPPSRVRVVTIGMTAGLIALPILWAVQWLSQCVMEWCKIHPVAQTAVTELQNSSLTGLEKIVFAVFTVLLAPVAEEALFRGILYPAIKQTGHPRAALWGTSVLFGIMHFNAASLAPLIFFAVILVYLYECTESLLAPIAAHAMFNAVNFSYLLFPNALGRLLHHS